MSRPTFYTAFSNSIDDNRNIPNLTDEAMKITDLLQELAFDDKLYFLKDEVFSFERLRTNFIKYGPRIDIFYFAGHGKDGCLQLFNNFTIKPEKMARIVNSTLANARLIFFNACETFPLAQQIIEEREELKDDLIIISCKKEINSFIAEEFATLFFTQIGQLGTFREAYNSARGVIEAVHDTRFKEFDCRKDVIDAGDDFDISFIEIKAEKQNEGIDEDCTPVIAAAATEQKVKTSIIGKDKLTRDALTTNYVHEVVRSITAHPEKIHTETLELLKHALVTAGQIAKGEEKKDNQATELFKRAAELLPGLSSASAFDSLINAEKNIDKPSVKKLIKSKISGNAIGGLIDRLSSIKL